MTEVLYHPKIKPEHLARKASVYLRQSSEKQVRLNKESQHLQYAVAEGARALGWKQVEIINRDLGSSAGIASARREGFEHVLSSVNKNTLAATFFSSKPGLAAPIGLMDDIQHAIEERDRDASQLLCYRE
jgi:hypothetical protein